MIEPERYELEAAPMYRFDVSRRDFLKVMGGGICVISLLQSSSAHDTDIPHHLGAGERDPDEIGAWLHIDQHGEVHVFTGKVEVGQNIRTSLSQAVAEELMVPFDSIHMVMGDTHQVPYDRGTFGSQTTPRMASHLRRVAAAAREMLKELAAKKWEVEASKLKITEGKAIHTSSNRSVSLGELTQGEEIVKIINDDVEDKPASEWKVCGKTFPKINGRDFVTGKHQYTYDIHLPNMQVGKILRPPQFGAQLQSLDASEAEALEGVTVVRDGNFVGVTAPDEPTAEKALKALKAKWDTRDGLPSSKTLYEHLKQSARESDGRGGWRGRGSDSSGSIEEGLKQAEHKLDATYHIAYIAHTPLEPRAGVAQWENGNLTVWTGTQRPFGVQSELAQAFSMPDERIRVIMPDTGSGYGGKHTGEAGVEAARLAKEVGKPVKVCWTRAEEFTWAYFRPAGVIEIKSGVTKDGKISAWEFHNYNSGSSAIRPLYDIPNQKTEYHRTDSPLRQGSYRCLAATANHFARESHIDDLAHAAKMDPLEFRLNNISDERLRDVLTAAAEKFGWKDKKSTKERGYGLACGFEKNGYVATCAEISIDQDSGEVKVVYVVEAFDCGPVVNPDGLNNQIEGMILMGIGGALFEAIEFENGKITNALMSKYRVPRFQDSPKIETVLMDRKDLPAAGAGEAPIVGIAPAIGNAIFHATGKRIRSMPMAPDGLKG